MVFAKCGLIFHIQTSRLFTRKNTFFYKNINFAKEKCFAWLGKTPKIRKNNPRTSQTPNFSKHLTKK